MKPEFFWRKIFDKRLPEPAWIERSKYYRYYHFLYVHQPLWADVRRMAAIYRDAWELRKANFDVNVDHIVPLKHPLVCGLHNEHNLVIVDAASNAAKSNDWWPGMWTEVQLEIPFGRAKVTSRQHDLGPIPR